MKLAGSIGQGAVLQRGVPLEIRGVEAAGKITLTVGDVTRTAEADEKGNFSVLFPPFVGSFDPVKVEITCEKGHFCFDVRFGDVFLAAGQSNMAYPVSAMINRDEITAAASGRFSVLDIFEADVRDNGEIYRPASPAAVLDPRWKWITGSDANVKNSSGLSTMVAERLAEGSNVPIGIINVALGGLSVDSYLPREVIEACPPVKNYLVKTGKYIAPDALYNTFGGTNFTQMSGVFNEKIAPLKGVRLAGIMWYLGESSAGDYAAARYFEKALSLVIKAFNRHFGPAPFIASDIALEYYNYGPDGYVLVNEAIDRAVSRFKNAESIPIYDVPNTWLVEDGARYYHPIHPVDKRLVAERFACLCSLAAKGQNVKIVPRITEVKAAGGNTLNVTVANANFKKSGLNRTIRGFTVAAEDGKYLSATAKVLGKNTLAVSCPYLKGEPRSLTYAFSLYNNRCNLQSGIFPVKQYRTKMENPKGKLYFSLNSWSECVDKNETESNFGPDLGCIKTPPAYSAGKITRACPIRLSHSRRERALVISNVPENAGYWYFGASPEINLAGHDAHLERFSTMTVGLRAEGEVEFCGLLIRTRGRVHRLVPAGGMTLPLTAVRTLVDVPLGNFVEPDLSIRPADPDELRNVSEMEFYFRSDQKVRVYLSGVILHD